MSTSQPGQQSEEELRAAYEAQMARIRVEHVLFDQVSMLVDLGMRRTGLAPGTEQERDPDQVRLAIDGVKAMIPLIEQFAADQVPAIKQAVSQLQLAYVRAGGTPPPGDAPAAAATQGQPAAAAGAPQAPGEPPAPEAEPTKPGEPGPAQRSGKLWVPGQ
jgi:hypothetical protein